MLYCEVFAFLLCLLGQAAMTATNRLRRSAHLTGLCSHRHIWHGKVLEFFQVIGD
jgi:hypothetical protein